MASLVSEYDTFQFLSVDSFPIPCYYSGSIRRGKEWQLKVVDTIPGFLLILCAAENVQPFSQKTDVFLCTKTLEALRQYKVKKEGQDA